METHARTHVLCRFCGHVTLNDNILRVDGSEVIDSSVHGGVFDVKRIFVIFVEKPHEGFRAGSGRVIYFRSSRFSTAPIP